jgi:2-iminoacetate synthase
VSSFSEHFRKQQSRIESLSALHEPLRPINEVLEGAEQGRVLTTDDAASLFAWAQDPERRAQIHTAAARIRERYAPKAIEFIIPVYLTSFCQNECLYCGYRRSNALAERIRLGLEEFERELELILSWGHRQIELVLSDDPEFGPRELIPYVELTRRKLRAVGGWAIALCSPVYEREDYARLAAAGVDWVAEWQETYHQPHFERWHFPGSKKREFQSRLDILDRAIGGGIAAVGLGALLGLYYWRYDVLAVMEHGNYLRQRYGIEPYTLGIPRLKPARGVLASQKPSRFTVSDDDFRLIVSVYHLAFPRTRLFFSTRESYELNLSLVAAGDLFTVDCETLPGGYLRRLVPGQFSTQQYPPRRDVAAEFQRRRLGSQYLAEESKIPAPLRQPTQVVKMDRKRWGGEHAQIRARLDDWQARQAWLATQGAEGAPVRQTGEGDLREILHFFKTFVIEHCREKETVLSQALSQHPEYAASMEGFRQAHERFGVDLDKYERQLTSYGLSGDPGVLLTLGGRIIRELRAHLEAEEAFALQVTGHRFQATGSRP